MQTKDKTRDLGRLFQMGVRDAKAWEWGPFTVSRTNLPTQTSYNLNVAFGKACGIGICFWSRNDDDQHGKQEA